MNRKKLIQRLNQLKDALKGKKLNELQKDIIHIKYTKDDIDLLTLKNKYDV